ncbi:integrase, catalytic region, zinc finger, CCHC-type containing protein [Tanacetum coccineum]
MDSVIPLGQKNILAAYMILSGADNRPPMLDKDMYDSWKSIMELYMQNKEHKRMILESVEHGPLIWPMIEENGVTNIILQGLPSDIYSLVNHHRVAKDLWERVQLLMQGTSLTKQESECKLYDASDKFTHIKRESLHNLPPEWSKFVTDVKLVKDLHTTNFDQLHAYLEQHELHANEVRLMHERNQDPLELARVVKCYNCQGEGHMARQCTQPKRPRNAAWYKDKAMLDEAQEAGHILDEEQLAFLADPRIPNGQAVQTIILNNVAFQTEDLDTYDSDCDDFSNAKAVLMANISNYGSNVISEVPHSETYLNDMENQSVHAMQDFEQAPAVDFTDNEIHSHSNIILYSQYLQETQQANVQDTNLQEKANKEQNNESVTTELERYKERVKTFEQRLNIV